MPAYYLDASAAVKGYVSERGSARVLDLLGAGPGHELYLSRVGVVETASAIFRRVETGETELEEALFAVNRLKEDANGTYAIIEVVSETSERAIEVAEKYRLRAYDCLQLATALLLHEQRVALRMEPLILVSSDRDLNAAAKNEGLLVEDPAESSTL
jgi:predicted nucleic acid-binding protein